MPNPQEITDDNAFRRFLIGFFSTALTASLLLALLNIYVDPYGAWSTGIVPMGYSESTTRIGKAELLTRYEGSIALIGNSRTRIGIDPNSDGLPETPACNLGMSGASLREVSLVLANAAKKPNIETTLVFIDFSMFLDGAVLNGDFPQSRFNNDLHEFEYRCHLLFNSQTITHSLQTARRFVSGERPRHTAFGFSPEKRTAEKSPADVPDPMTVKLLRQLASTCNETLDDHTVDHDTNDDDFELFCQSLRSASKKGKRVVVIVHPLHALYLDSYWQQGLETLYCDWLRRLTNEVNRIDDQQVSLWNFSGWYAQSCVPFVDSENGSVRVTPNPWYVEPSHYRARLGDQIIRRIFSAKDADTEFGVLLTHDSVENEIDSIIERRHQWQTTHATSGDAAFIVASNPELKRSIE